MTSIKEEITISEIATDEYWMKQALELAKRGQYTTSPNPCVGCVIVKDGKLLGQGFHIKAGQGHAEVNALQDAKEKNNDVTGSTVYVTLEPCSHYGRTPPCALTLVNHKVSRVVAAMLDPNPKVSGNGFKILNEAGIKTEYGLLENEAEQLNREYLHRMRTGRPFVQLKLACSLDGKIALANGESKWITSEEARSDVQIFRAKASAILTTSKTVIADNPSLNVRRSDLPSEVLKDYPIDEIRQPSLVLLDSKGIVPNDFNIYKANRRVIVVTNNQNKEALLDTELQKCITSQNVCYLSKDLTNLDQKDSAISNNSSYSEKPLKPLLEKLVNYDINSIWVEAGATLAGSLLKQNLVDELIVYIAPKILGSDAKSMVEITGYQSLSDIPQFEISTVKQVGSDIRVILKRKNA